MSNRHTTLEEWILQRDKQPSLINDTSSKIKKDFSVALQAEAVFRQINLWKEALISRGQYSFCITDFRRLANEFILVFSEDVYAYAFQSLSHEAISKYADSYPALKQRIPDPTAADPSLTQWAEQWLVRPHFRSYKQRLKELSSAEQSFLQTFIAARLQEHVHHPPSRRTFFELTAYHRMWEEGIGAWERSSADPMQFSREEKRFFSALIANDPERALPVCLQITEQLIEKRQTDAYQNALNWVSAVKSFTERDYFESWLALLRRKYRSLRSFIQELDNVDFLAKHNNDNTK
ncbi:hypothetical protein [Salisediminibacterium halotolerans]|uniref:Uncharacterized protein n=1 Tax=Salisediminibacterium halotolerans TaxID=517425 RepID=A0A1H9VEU3_9BACI|nr:hypothetical protein [Salisediminibacterium haloalkalitolerans]SES20320.1 hypothetical protein SAMN05444126_12033 [Salisediminibacterium haloalkalitolerans]